MANGQHLLEYFRSYNLLAESTIFIIVTAETSYSSVAGAAELKPDAYMLKPRPEGGALFELRLP